MLAVIVCVVCVLINVASILFLDGGIESWFAAIVCFLFAMLCVRNWVQRRKRMQRLQDEIIRVQDEIMRRLYDFEK